MSLIKTTPKSPRHSGIWRASCRVCKLSGETCVLNMHSHAAYYSCACSLQAIPMGLAYVVSSLTDACRLSHRQGAASAAKPSSRGASVRTYSLLGGLFGGSKGDMGAAGSKAPGAREGWSPATGETPSIMAAWSILEVLDPCQPCMSLIVCSKPQSATVPLGRSSNVGSWLRCAVGMYPSRHGATA